MKKRYGNGKLGTTATCLMQCNPDESITINQIWIVNTDSSSRTYTMYHTAAGETPATHNTMVSAVSVAAGRNSSLDGPFYLNSGEKIYALASVVDVVNIFVHAETF